MERGRVSLPSDSNIFPEQNVICGDMLSQDTNLKQKQFKVKGLLRPASNPSLQVAMHSPRQKFTFSITDLLAPLAIYRPTRGGQDWLISDTHGDCGHWFWCWLSIIFLSRWYVGSPAVVLFYPSLQGESQECWLHLWIRKQKPQGRVSATLRIRSPCSTLWAVLWGYPQW